MRIFFKTIQSFLVVVVFLSLIYFFTPLLADSLENTWLANRQLTLFVMTLMGFSLTLFAASAFSDIFGD